MSDPALGAVRTGTRTADAAEPGTPADPPASTTQSIPTGTNRAVQPAQAAPAAQPPAATGAAAPAAPATPPVQTAAPATGTARAALHARTQSAPQAGRKAAGSGRGPRRARLQLRHIDTWSAFKISLVLSIALFFIWLVAVGVLYGVLSGLGVFATLNELFGQLGSASGGGGGGDVITPGVVFGAAAVIGGINVVLLTALGTVSTFIYNLCSDLVGGLEVTLSERD